MTNCAGGQQTCNDVNSRFVFPTGTILGTDDIVSILAPGHDVCVLEEAFEYIRAYPGFLVVKPRKRDGVYWPHMDSRLRSAGQDALVYTVFYDFDSARTVWSSIGIDEPRIPHFRVMDFSPCNFDMQRELEEREDE